MLSALRQVKHPYGQVFWLRAYEEMSFKEIGEIFDKSENWARVNYFRAKTKIRKVAARIILFVSTHMMAEPKMTTAKMQNMIKLAIYVTTFIWFWY